MKTTSCRTLPVLTLIALCVSDIFAAPIGTAFTYQGRLVDGVSPANGNYAVTFTLYNDSVGGTQVGPVLTNHVMVTGGLFTTILDFGINAFNGDALWLELAVRTNGTAIFTNLSPRQALSATPYAIAAQNVTGALPATQLSGILPSALLSGTYSAALTLDNPGNAFAGSGSGLTGVNAVTVGGLGAGSFWQLNGNAGTTSDNFLGTTDGQPLELRVNNMTGLQLQSSYLGTINLVGGYGNEIRGMGNGATIGGGFSNIVSTGGHPSFGCTISGGTENSLMGNLFAATISGGRANNISGTGGGTISGGERNSLSFSGGSVISGGSDNHITLGAHGTICGGNANTLSGSGYLGPTIGGGMNNKVLEGHYGTIGGGIENAIVACVSSVVGGGANNAVTGSPYSSIGGGESNTVLNVAYGAITGGSGNTLGNSPVTYPNATEYCYIGGGSANYIADARHCLVAGGSQNVIRDFTEHATISGGSGNLIIRGRSLTIGGGTGNFIEGSGAWGATIGGGDGNVITRGDDQFDGGSTIAGGRRNYVGSGYSAICGGEANSVGGLGWATIGGGGNNSNNGKWSVIGGGLSNSIVGAAHVLPPSSGSTIGGGRDNLISVGAPSAVIGGGLGNTIEGTPADNYKATGVAIGGGSSNTASRPYCTIPGGLQARPSSYGQMAYASGAFDKAGDAQTSVYVCRGATTDATSTDLALDGISERMMMPTNSTWAFDILVTARMTNGTSAAYQILGAARNINGITTLATAPKQTIIVEDVAAWNATAAASATNDTFVVRVNGAAATPIRWVATVRTTEVTY